MGLALKSIEKTKKEFAKRIEYINDFKRSLKDNGLEVHEKDVWDLEGTFQIYLNKVHVADLYWNVPFYIYFEAIVEQDQPSFKDDTVNSDDAWFKNLKYASDSLTKLHKKEYF